MTRLLTPRLSRPALLAGTGVAALALSFVAAPAASADVPAPTCTSTVCTVTFTETGAPQTWTVPTGVSSVSVDVKGAQGGASSQGAPAGDGAGGAGGEAAGSLAVATGDQLSVVVGGQGTSGQSSDGAAPGGYAGGGDGSTIYGSGGGGGSFVFDGAGSLLLAGGGGGGGSYVDGNSVTGGAGGGANLAGANGTDASTCDGCGANAGGGGGAHVDGDGSGGAGAGGLNAGADGTGQTSSPTALAVGGDGGDDAGAGPGFGGGGGGGGYFAGGGAGNTYYLSLIDNTDNAATGGGGSGFAASSLSDVSGDSGVNSGDGSVTISYEQAPTFTGARTATFREGLDSSFDVGASGAPTPSLVLVDPQDLPSGLSFADNDNGTASFFGTPDDGTAGVYQVTVQASNDAGSSTESVAIRVLARASQSITFTTSPPNPGAIGNHYHPHATGGGSGNPVVFTADAASTGCTVSNGVATFTAVGTCVIDANQDGGNGYSAAPQVQQKFKVVKRSQYLGFTQPANEKVGASESMSVKASSGLTVKLTDNTPTVCSLSGKSVKGLKAGTCSITASQPGNATYSAATPITRTFQIRA